MDKEQGQAIYEEMQMAYKQVKMSELTLKLQSPNQYQFSPIRMTKVLKLENG